MSDISNVEAGEIEGGEDGTKAKIAATGGILGAIAASACCVLPLTLFSLGLSGAWIGQLTALSPYQPIFLAITVGFLGYGYWLVYRKPKVVCATGEACARPLSNRLIKSSLWFATIMAGIAFVWPYVIPYFLY